MLIVMAVIVNPLKGQQLQYGIQKLTIGVVLKMFSIEQCKQKLSVAKVHTKVNNCCASSVLIALDQSKQRLSLASCVHKSYHGFDAILQFLAYTLFYVHSISQWIHLTLNIRDPKTRICTPNRDGPIVANSNTLFARS